MEIRVPTKYQEHLKDTDGNHVAAALLQIADTLWVAAPQLIHALENIADAINER